MAFRGYISCKGQKQGQFKGESTRANRKDKWVECIGFKMGSSVPVDANSGAPKGYRQHKPVTFTKEWGAASAQFLQAHWTNETLDEVVIEMVARAADGQKEVVTERITLKNAIVVNVDRYSDQPNTSQNQHDVDHLEDVGIAFQHIVVENPVAGTSTSDDWQTVDRH
jgi:type VI secretion system secreted protein Hcp